MTTRPGTPSRAPAGALVTDPVQADLWGIDDVTLARASPVEAVSLLWTGWRVAHLAPYRTDTGFVYATAVLTRADSTDTTGWGTTILRFGFAEDIATALDAWATKDDLSRRLIIGYFTTAAILDPDADLASFGPRLAAQAATRAASDEERAAFHHPRQWQAVWNLPVEVAPDIATVRTLWALAGLRAPEI